MERLVERVEALTQPQVEALPFAETGLHMTAEEATAPLKARIKAQMIEHDAGLNCRTVAQPVELDAAGYIKAPMVRSDIGNPISEPAQSLKSLQIAGVGIRQDADGRYCLNDLHRAAGGEKRHQPSDFMRTATFSQLMVELNRGLDTPGNPGVSCYSVIQGRNGGTYVAKELVYAYAMWISPAFHLAVIRAYDALVTGAAPAQFPVPRVMVRVSSMLHWHRS